MLINFYHGPYIVRSYPYIVMSYPYIVMSYHGHKLYEKNVKYLQKTQSDSGKR